ncbi:MAG: NAD-dependent epimerase/dehydratase family protein [Chloroflexota bacterium]
MKILVIGGTRFFGRAFTELALSKGHDVTVFHRGQSDSEHFDGATRIIGDRNTDLEKLGDDSWDAVLDTCGFTPNQVTETATYLKDKVKHYVFISSISVYTESEKMNRNEDADLLDHPEGEPTDELKMENYGSLKVLCEQAAEAIMPNQVTQIRPGLIVGPYDASNRFTYWVTRVAKGGDVLVPGDGSRLSQVIDARDLAAFTLKVIEDKNIGIFHVAGPQEPHTVKSVVETVKRVTDSDANFIYVDEDFLTDNEVRPWMELPLWIPSATGDSMMNVDISRALDAGLTLRPLEETIQDTLDWYREIDGDSQEWAAGMKPEREADLLEKWANH